MAGTNQGWNELAEMIRMLSGEWAVPVLAVLSHGPLRYGKLAKRIRESGSELGAPPGRRTLHDRTLASTLRSLEVRGLVKRRVTVRAVPPTVVYELTDKARGLLSKVRSPKQ